VYVEWVCKEHPTHPRQGCIYCGEAKQKNCAKVDVEALTHYQLEAQAREAFEKDCADSLVDLTLASKISANHDMPYTDGETTIRWWGFRDGYDCGFNAALQAPRSDTKTINVYGTEAKYLSDELTSAVELVKRLRQGLRESYHEKQDKSVRASIAEKLDEAEQWLKNRGDV
jgi:hypothetical protein